MGFTNLEKKVENAAEENEQKRLVLIPRTCIRDLLTYSEWMEKALKLGCTPRAAGLIWEESYIEEEGTVTKDGAAPSTFGEENIDFDGSKDELGTFLRRYDRTLYNSLFLRSMNGKERDWFT